MRTVEDYYVKNPEWKLGVLTAFFITALTVANVTASKLVILGQVGPVTLLTPAAVVAYAITFAMTDIIAEVWGKRIATLVVWAGFASQLLLVALVQVAIWLPIAPFMANYQQVYAGVLGSSPLFVVAGLIAYVISQNHDVWAFHVWKRKTGGKWLWLRNNASTMVSQLIDTVIFITLAFGILPAVFMGQPLIPWEVLPGLIAGQYIVKWLIALADTPFVYLGVRLVAEKKR